MPCSVEGIGAGLGNHRHLGAGGAPVFRRKGRSLNAELLQRIQRHQVAHPSKGIRCWKLAGPALAQIGASRSQVGADSIHREVIGVRPLAVHTELALLVKVVRHQHHSRG